MWDHSLHSKTNINEDDTSKVQPQVTMEQKRNKNRPEYIQMINMRDYGGVLTGQKKQCSLIEVQQNSGMPEALNGNSLIKMQTSINHL